MRTVALRVAALALLLLLALVAVISIRTMQRLPDTVVYFVVTEETHFRLEPSYRHSRTNDLAAALTRAVEALIAGPTASERQRGLSSAIPPDTRLLGLRLDGSTVHIDLSAEFASGGGTASMVGRLYQLLYTLTQPAVVEAVALSIEGERVEALGGEGLIVAQPWRRTAGGLPVW
jgi:spore germination protein GerM